MSTTVDERVVEMRFDNRDFEKNVSTSMSTLEKLKQKLNLTGASKNLDELNRAAKRVDFSPVSNSLDNVVTRFSHAQMTIQHQIDRYMDKLVMMGERAVKALTVDPIKTGFQEYETQMNSVQTILANTQSKGSTLDDVNKALDELNTYADKTIYNFTEMTRNIGTFTAAGVDLDTSVNAIQGIANLAAISGSTSQQASTAMYQLSQALASGTVKLMDWNSVVNAGMGGQVFQDALKETARAHGVAIDQMIKDEGSFRETLSKGWLTSEILTDTLQKFTLTTEGLTEQQIEANREMLRAKGYTDAQIDEIFKLGETATDAATKVKTFTQLWDVLKESAQSGWSQTWKLIIGDFEEAKALLSPLADVLTGFIGKMSDARNWIVQGVVDFTTPWTNIMKKLEGAGLLKTVQKVTDSVMDAAKKIEYYQDIVNKVWRGDYKNSDTGRYGLLDADGYNHKVVQSLVNKGYQYELTIEDIEEAEKKFGVTIGETAKTTEEMSNVIANLSDEQLRNAGLTEEEIRLYRDLEKYAKESGISIDELAKKMSENDGRTLLIDSFKNIGNSIIAIFKAIGQAWSDVFDPISIVGIYHVIEAFNEWTKSLNLVDKNTGELNETGQKIKRTLAGVFAIVDVLTTILGGGFKIAFKIVSGILEYFNLDLLSFTAMIGDALVAFSDWFDSIFDVSGAVKWLIDMVKKAIPVVKGWIDAFKDLPFVQKAISGIKDAFAALKSIDMRDFGRWIVEGFKGGFADGVKNMLNAVFEFGKKILTTIKEVLGIHSPSTEFFDIATWCIKGFVNGLINGVKYIGTGIVNIGKTIIDAFKDSGVVDGIKSIFGTIKDVLSKIDFGKILAAIPIGIALLTIKKIYDFASSFGKVADSIGDILDGAADVLTGFAKVLKGIAFKTYTEGIKELAISLLIMVASVALLTFLDTDKLYDAVAIIMVLAGILGILVFAVNQMSKASASFKWKEGFNISGLTSSLASIGLAMLLLAASIKLVGSMDPDVFKQGLLGMAAIIAGLVIVMAAFKGLGDNKSAESIHKVGKLIFKLSLSMILLVAFCKLASKLTPGEMGKAALFAAGFAIFVKSLCKSAHGHGKYVDKVGKLIFKLSLSMLLLVAFCKLASKLTLGEMGKAALFAAGFAVFVGILVRVTKIDKNQKIARLGGLMLSITLAMMLMIGVCKLVGKLETRDIIAGAIFMAAFIGFAWLLTKVTTISNEQKSAKIAGTILAMALAVAALAVVAVLMSMMTTEGLIKGVSAVVALCAGMALMVGAAKHVSGDAMKSLIVLVAAVAIMAIIVGVFANMDAKSLLTATGSLGLLLGMFTVLLKVSKGLNGAGKLIKTMGTMLGVVAVLSALLAGLAFVAKYAGNKQMLSAAGSLSIIMLALSASMVIIGKTGRISTTVAKNLLPLTLAIAGISLILGLLSVVAKFSGGDSMIAAAESLSMIMLALSGAMAIMGHTGRISTTVAKNLLPLTLAIAGISLILAGLAVVANMTSSGAMLTAAVSLSAIMLALSVSMVILGLVSPTAKMAVGAAGLMVLVIAGLALVLGVMAALDINLSIQNAIALSLLVVALSGALVLLGIAGIMGPAAFVGIAALAALVIGMGAVIIGIGALMDKVPQLEEFLNKGIPILGKIGQGIGEFIGGIVGGIMNGIGNALPTFGQQLSDFMTNAQGFIDGCKNVDATTLAGAGYLTGAIIAITAANLVDSIAQFLPFVGSLSDLGTDLSQFMLNAMPFIMGLKMIDENAVAAAGCVAGMILALTVADLIAGIGNFVGLGVNFADFGQQLKDFGTAIVAFSKTVSEGGIDEEAVQAAARAGEIMAKLQTSTYGEGGLLQLLFGEKNLSSFGDQLVDFGTAIVKFSDAVEAGIDQNAVDAAAKAGEVMAALQKDISSEGGLMGLLFGDKDLASFGQQCADYGAAMVAFSNAVEGGIDEKAVETAATAGELMAALQTSLNENEDFVDKLKGGDDSLSNFGDNLVAFGENIVEFADDIADLDTDAVEAASKAAGMMLDIQDALPEDDWFDGKMTIDEFGKKLKTFGKKLVDFSTEVGEVDKVKIEKASSAAGSINGMLKALAESKTAGFNFFDDDKAGKLASGLKTFQLKAVDLASTSVEGFFDTCDDIVDLVEDLGEINLESIKTFKSAVDLLADVDINGLMDNCSGDLSNLSSIGQQIIEDISSGLSSGNDKLSSTLKSVLQKTSWSATDYGDIFNKNGVGIINAFIKGIASKKDSAKNAFKAIINNCAAMASTGYTSFYSAGSYLVDGFTAGISANSYKAAAQAAAMAKAAKQAAEEALGINSPSKVFYGIGDYTGQGFVNALGDYAVKSYKAGSAMADSARKGLTNAISKATDVLSGKTDMQPTIRPVVDLSGVESGTSAINSMLNMGSRIGISANVGAVSSMMSRRSQNGANSDIVAAIDRLDKHLDNVGGTSYSVNGVTYDDGSNVKDAIETIVRAARIERRV